MGKGRDREVRRWTGGGGKGESGGRVRKGGKGGKGAEGERDVQKTHQRHKCGQSYATTTGLGLRFVGVLGLRV
jgi:hypothetical protein